MVNVIDSTHAFIESLDEEINELSISADLSINRLKDFKANLLQSKKKNITTHTELNYLGMRSENLLNKFHPVYDTSLLMGIPTQIYRQPYSEIK